MRHLFSKTPYICARRDRHPYWYSCNAFICTVCRSVGLSDCRTVGLSVCLSVRRVSLKVSCERVFMNCRTKVGYDSIILLMAVIRWLFHHEHWLFSHFNGVLVLSATAWSYTSRHAYNGQAIVLQFLHINVVIVYMRTLCYTCARCAIHAHAVLSNGHWLTARYCHLRLSTITAG